MRNAKGAKKIAYLGVFTALALIFSYVESLIPFFFGVPGMKLGLANSLIVIILFTMGAKEALGINLIRIVISGFLFGNVFAIVYSLAGGILSFFVMLILKHTKKLGIISISTAGAIAHNLGQILVAMVILQSVYLGYYFSVLMISGFITGFIMGIISNEVVKRLKRD